MTPVSMTDADRHALSSAAALLDLVGHCAPDDAAETAIHALHAADLAVAAGATVSARRMPLTLADVRTALVDGLRHLSTLSEPAHASDAIADVSDATHRALAAAGGD